MHIVKCFCLLILFSVSMAVAQSPSLLWSHHAGEISDDYANAITTDDSGYVYTTGMIEGVVDMDPGASVYNIGGPGKSAFVMKQDSAGILIWAVATESNSTFYMNEGTSIKYDHEGHLYITGRFWGTVDFDPGPGNYSLTAGALLYDVFLWKLTTGGTFVRALSFNGQNSDIGVSLDIDSSGNTIITGLFSGNCDFDPGPGIYILNGIAQDNIFVCSLDSTGNFLWAQKISGIAKAYSLVTDIQNNIYITGFFIGYVDFNPDSAAAFAPNPQSDERGFLLKMDSNGNFSWVKLIGGTSLVYAYGLSYDPQLQALYISGTFKDTADFDPGPSVYNLSTLSGIEGGFILKTDTSGSFKWAAALTGQGGEYFDSDITHDAHGNVYVTGGFIGTLDFDPDSSAVYEISSSTVNYWDIYILKLDSSGIFQWADAFGGNYNDIGRGVAVSNGNQVYVCGYYKSDSIRFDSNIYYQLDSLGYVGEMFNFRMGNCSAGFTLYADTIPHQWLVLNESYGVNPLSYLWSWGDSTYSAGATPFHTYADSGHYDVSVTITDAEGCVSTYTDSAAFLYRGLSNTIVTIQVLPQVITSLQTGLPNDDVKVYPNPFTSELHVVIDGGDDDAMFIRIYNAVGQEIYAATSVVSHSIIPSESFETGLYILEIQKGEMTRRFRAIKD
jgi:hypothetical protein